MIDERARLADALAGRYRIERELGAGGMATVYLAEDLKHRRQVAIKVFRPDLAAVLGPERFLREIAIVAALNHPRILALHDSGEAGGFLYYVMPHVRGETLRQRLEREGPLPIEVALQITRQVASALQYAHDEGLIHRDMKPENVLFHEGDAMVTDFGIAVGPRRSGERLTLPGLTVGTLGYMSPEQVAGTPPPDARSDQYGLACLLYEMLTGELPFAGPTPHSVHAKQMADPVPSARRLRDRVPPWVDLALIRAMARTPADRFTTVTEFADALSQPTAAPPARHSVAVLPFLNLSPDPENEFFADGITEDVIAQLTKIRALKVISRTSIMPFRKREAGIRAIAAQLGVATVLDGSVRRAGDRVRIVAELIDAETDEHLWVETYDRRLTDIFAIQSDVALHIAEALRAELSSDERERIGREPTSNLDAYQRYLQGRQQVIRFTESGLREGIRLYREALEFDPRYVQALVGLSMAYSEAAEGGFLPPVEAHAGARAAAERALALNPGLGEAHSALAHCLMTAEFDWNGAEERYLRALDLSPGNADIYSHFSRLRSAQARFEEAVALARRAQQLDPLAHRADLSTALLRAGRYQEAEQEIKAAIARDPNYDRGYATLGWARFLQGDRDGGLADMEHAVALSRATTWRAQLGEMYGLAGRTAEARAILDELESEARGGWVSPYVFAYVQTGLGEHDQAIDWLERAHAERAGAIFAIRGSFLLAPLQPHPRFQALLRKLGLG